MAYALLASTSATFGATSYDFELYEEGFTGTAGTLHIVSDPIIEWGETSPNSIFKPHLPLTVEFRVRDVGRTLLARFAGQNDADFKLQISETSSGNTVACGPIDLQRINTPSLGMTNPVFTLRMYDGLKPLEDIEYAEAGWQTCAETYRAIFDQVPCDLDVYTYLLWEHNNQSTSDPHAAGFRFNDDHWKLAGDPTNYFSVLQRMTSFVQAQVTQEGGAWRILERYYRTGAMDYVAVDTADTVTTGSETKSVALADSDIQWKKSTERQLRPIREAKSIYEFEQQAFENGEFKEWNEAQTLPSGWIVPSGFSTPPRVQDSGGDDSPEHNTSAHRLEQHPTHPVRIDDDITITIRFEYSLLGTGTSAPVARVILEDTANDTHRYMDASGNWSTTDQNVEQSLTSGGAHSVTIETQAPATGTIKLQTAFMRDPDMDGTEEYDWYRYQEFSMTNDNAISYAEREEYTSSGASSGDWVTETFYVGGWLGQNPHEGVMDYLDDTSGAWEKAMDWVDPATGTSTLPFHAIRPSRRTAQQGQLLKGLDLELLPDVDVEITDTITYDGVQYVPVYVKWNMRKRTRRVVAYELRT